MISKAAFFDTNILVYAVSADGFKKRLANDLIAAGGWISVQILNEFANVSRLKLGKSWPQIQEKLDEFRAVFEPAVPITLGLHDAALALARRYGFSINDALIVAAAMDAGCETLFTEDMQHGQRVSGLTIENPFKRA